MNLCNTISNLLWAMVHVVIFLMITVSKLQAYTPEGLECQVRDQNDYFCRNGCECNAIVSVPPEPPQGSWFPNGTLYEPELSADGLRLYFSNYPYDLEKEKPRLYILTRESVDQEFGNPVELSVLNSEDPQRTNRGISVITDPVTQCEHVFFVRWKFDQPIEAADIYEARQMTSNGKCLWNNGVPEFATPTKVVGDVNDQGFNLNVSVFSDGRTMIYTTGGSCDARLHIAHKTPDGRWMETAQDPVAAINRWADDQDSKGFGHPACNNKGGILDPHVTYDGQAFYFVYVGNIFRSDWDGEKFHNVKPVGVLNSYWVEGPTTTADGREVWFHIHAYVSGTLHPVGKIGSHTWKPGCIDNDLDGYYLDCEPHDCDDNSSEDPGECFEARCAACNLVAHPECAYCAMCNHPEAQELKGDGVDSNCDGEDAPRNSCFIASATTGTELAKKITVLRTFRDTYLLNNKFGKALVDSYYKLSPPIVNYIAERKWLKALVRQLLLPVIKCVSFLV